MGIEGLHTYLKSGSMDKVSTPPGFASQTSFVLRKVHRDKELSRSNSGQEQTTVYGTDDADNFKMLLTKRPWIVHDSTTPSLNPMKSEVRPRRELKVSKTEVLEEAPVFNPTEEEFNDTLSYIASLRDKAEPYGICCVVPPPSWKPPCLLKEKKIWEASTFVSQVQLFDGIHTENPKIKKEADADIDDASEKVKFCRIQRGTTNTLEKFKNFADSYKKRHFSIKDEVLGSDKSSPSVNLEELTVADIEKEYRQLLESPLVEIGVLYGNDLDTKTLGSGFPLSGSSESCNYRTSGWNLNNTAKLPGSLLSFEDCESICVPRLSVGMCLSSQQWKSEKERLYALCYSHVGSPRVWYSVAGCHRSKFEDTMNSLIPERPEEQTKMSHNPVMIMSPYALSTEGIPVTRCVQSPGQYVIIFPGSYYSAFDCGFNCLEKVNFAPLDWLPHGDIAVQLNQEKCKRSLISYDELLLNAAREAVKCLREYSLNKKNLNNTRWKESCGKDGIFSSFVKSRIKQEKNRREFLSNSLESQRMDKSYDDVRKRECCVCFADLHLSAVRCSCSADRYSCLSHMKKLCTCPCDRKSFLYRYTIDELNFLVEALEGKLSAMFKWGNIDRDYCASRAITSSQLEDKGKRTDDVVVSCNKMRTDVIGGAKEQTKTKVKARSIMEILKVKDGEDDNEKGILKPCSKKSTGSCDSPAKKQKKG